MASDPTNPFQDRSEVMQKFPEADVAPMEWALAIHFSQNRQPCMSGDPRDRLSSQQRRQLRDAALAAPKIGE